MFWHLSNNNFLKSGQSLGKFSSSILAPILHKKPLQTEDSPLHYEPYCYSNRLVIGRVDSEDSKIDFIVRSAGETRWLNLNLPIRPPINGACRMNLIGPLVIMLQVLLLFNKE